MPNADGEFGRVVVALRELVASFDSFAVHNALIGGLATGLRSTLTYY